MSTSAYILKHIQYLDQNNQFQAIIDYILSSHEYHQSIDISCELARAYNNLYWQYKHDDYRHYLLKAVDILLSLNTQHLNNEQQDICDYNLGYAYYFLEEYQLAQDYLLKVNDYCLDHVDDLLKQIDWVKRYRISAVQSSLSHTHYLLQDIFAYMQQYCPLLLNSFKQGVTSQDLSDFAQHIQAELPNPFQQMHLCFSGQYDKHILSDYYSYTSYGAPSYYFVGLNEIADIQRQWQQRLHDYFGESWQSLSIPMENRYDNFIRQQLYHPKWLPILVVEHGFLCIDLAPVYMEDYGQIICVHLSPLLEECYVMYYCDALQDFWDLFWQSIQEYQSKKEVQQIGLYS